MMICYVIKPPGIKFLFLIVWFEKISIPSTTPIGIWFVSFPPLPGFQLALFVPLITLTAETFPGLAMGNGFLWDFLSLSFFCLCLFNAVSFIICNSYINAKLVFFFSLLQIWQKKKCPPQNVFQDLNYRQALLLIHSSQWLMISGTVHI